MNCTKTWVSLSECAALMTVKQITPLFPRNLKPGPPSRQHFPQVLWSAESDGLASQDDLDVALSEGLAAAVAGVSREVDPLRDRLIVKLGSAGRGHLDPLPPASSFLAVPLARDYPAPFRQPPPYARAGRKRTPAPAASSPPLEDERHERVAADAGIVRAGVRPHDQPLQPVP
jgi:hypothetical protein